MSAEQSKSAELRTALTRYRERHKQGKYPGELRERARAYASERRRGGASVRAIAAELGVKDETARAWLAPGRAMHKPGVQAEQFVTAERSSNVSLVPVVVRDEAPSTTRLTRFDVEFTDGTRLSVSGMTGRELLEAIDSLRRSR